MKWKILATVAVVNLMAILGVVCIDVRGQHPEIMAVLGIGLLIEAAIGIIGAIWHE